MDFQPKRDRVEDHTPQEEYQLLLRNLPPQWQREIVTQETQKAKHTFQVRISNIPDKSPVILQLLVEHAIGMPVPCARLTPQGFLVTCPDPLFKNWFKALMDALWMVK